VFVVPSWPPAAAWGNWFRGPWVRVAEGALTVAALVGFWRAPYLLAGRAGPVSVTDPALW
jgi:hypothetical protein